MIYTTEAVKAIMADIYREHYPAARQGQFDFPDETTWVQEKVEQHFINSPELHGFIWDEGLDDWVPQDYQDWDPDEEPQVD